MFGSAVLEVAIGLMFIYTVLSVVSSMIKEGISQAFKWRSKMLAEGIERLLLDSDVRKLFYDHPLVRSLFRGRGDKTDHPTEIPTSTFTAVVVDLAESLAGKPAAPRGGASEGAAASDGDALEPVPGSVREGYTRLRETVEALPESDLRTTLRAFLRTSEARAESFKDSLEGWFEATMAEVTDWYKQRSQAILLVLSAVLVVAGNVDTVALADALWTQPTVRDSLTAIAENYVEDADAAAASASGPAAAEGKALQKIQARIGTLELPLGWQSGFPAGASDVLSKILGLLLTTFAVSLGSQFWFDLLRKAVRFRSSARS